MTASRRDLLVVLLGTVATLALAQGFDAFDWIYRRTRGLEWLQLDEILVAVVVAVVLLAWFSARRMGEAQAAHTRLERILETLVREATLEETLALLVAEGEHQIRGMHGIIVAADPTLETPPRGKAAATVGAEEAGRLVAAAQRLADGATRRGIIVISDIDEPSEQAPPLGEGCHRLGFRACWSSAVLASDGAVLGVVAGFFRAPRRPRSNELERLQTVARLAAVAIERRVSDRALRRSAEDYRLLFENASDAILVIRPDDEVILAANPHADELYGYAHGELVGRSVKDFSIDPSRGEERIRETLAHGRSYHFETTHRRRDGSEIRLEINASVVSYEGQRAILSFNRDVTEQRRLAQAILQTQKMEALGRLAGGVSHDFNNLLTAIRGAAELAEMSPRVDSQLRDYLQLIQTTSDRAASLTRQLLTFSRHQVVQSRRIDVNATVTGMESMLHRVLPENIELAVRLGPDLPAVFIDPGQLELVILNLVVNACDAMPAGGRVKVSTEERELSDGRRGTALAVCDGGTGMSEEVKARAFEPFFTTKGAGKGTGLGLSLVYGTVQQAGGSVDLDSVVGRGTTFTITLPVAEAEAPAEVAAEAREERRAVDPSLTGASVLVVEDNDQVRRFIVLCLRELGIAVEEAASGTAALERLRGEGAVQLLLTDIGLPEMAGPDLAREALALRPELRVRFMSGYGGDRLGPLLDDGAPLLPKPFTRAELIAYVRQALA